jgi:hypothetical protein
MKIMIFKMQWCLISGFLKKDEEHLLILVMQILLDGHFQASDETLLRAEVGSVFVSVGFYRNSIKDWAL